MQLPWGPGTKLPKTSTGKIQKFELRARVRSGSAIDLAGDCAEAAQDQAPPKAES
jgi:fatty-acyl-CoA synthase